MGKTTDGPIGEIPLELAADLDLELVEDFINDGREQLLNIEQGALALEKDGSNPEVLHTLFRAFHTFKGNAGFLEFDAVGQLAHALESLLSGAREGRLQIDSVMIDIILKSRDTLEEYVDEIEAQVTGKKPRHTIHLPTATLRAATRFILDGTKAEVEAVAPEALQETLALDPAPEPSPDARARFDKGNAILAVKVATSKLDSLVDLAGELLIAQSVVIQNISTPGIDRHVLARNLDQLTRVSKELQRMAMSMRMVPIREAFQKMERLVRDVAALQGKQVQLIIEGEDTEVDRTIAEKFADPLMHMIRNAVDHAIELPEKRVAAGKHAVGTIHLRAYHRSGSIIIEVEDDGIGLDHDRIVAKAVKQGLLRRGAAPDEREILHLILQPGFSTAEVVTSISGRGVGMDVVAKNITQLRGKLDLKTVPGHGTKFTIRLPLTLAIIDGLIIGVGGQRYILPTSSVRESLHPKSCTLTSLPGDAELVQIRNEVIPLLRLREHFSLDSGPASAGEGIMVVVESDGKKRCLLADELIGRAEVVIRNLGEVFKTDPMVSGGAILGDGCVGLILDAAALVHLQSKPAELQLAI
jgi:two-component system chemotaxis sensor kinase CheA